EGRRIDSVGRRGKFLIAPLEDGLELIMHLGMTGAFRFDVDDPYVRARLKLDDGRTLSFRDVRRFGRMAVVEAGIYDAIPTLAMLGPEPLSDEFDPDVFAWELRRTTSPVKPFLLSQRPVAGVGNIYADEALHRAGIHPERPANALEPAQTAALRDAVLASLEAGIAAKGATIDDFRHPDGVRGSFQDEFLVHRRAGEPCPACGTLVRKLVVAGRGTYVCETCQPPV
ncbi:MAG: bifunctional DNA-formamidopyrimidine glycosylase/DNA-(apurinic or apyrimidinic site) lyase, partial [Actinobacteria bacterium]|nr:bifunctional DNA-formamidopyrimidine glycosylase/DNA-(apurinic or apyrimidinic site) lyase [Actinomycetota bacterium]